MYKFNLEKIEYEMGLDDYNKDYNFTDDVETLLFDLLTRVNDDKLKINNENLISNLGMVNTNYFKFINHKEEISKLKNVPLEVIEDFYSVSLIAIYNTINTVNTRLFNKGLISDYSYSNDIHTYIINKDIKTITIDVKHLQDKVNKKMAEHNNNVAVYLHEKAKEQHFRLDN